MNAEVKGGQLSVSLLAIIESLSKEDQVIFIDALSCKDDVIKNVIDQILDGWTEQGSHGSILCTAAADPACTGLDYARRKVAKQAGETAKAEIERLEDALKCREKECADLREAAYTRRNLL